MGPLEDGLEAAMPMELEVSILAWHMAQTLSWHANFKST